MVAYSFGKGSLENLEGVTEGVTQLCTEALKYSTVDFSIIDGLRGQEEQEAMFLDGKSELDGTILISDHQLGLAVDVIPYIEDMDVWDIDDAEVAKAWLELYRAFMRASMKLGLELEFGIGYDISGSRDYPHISVK